MTDEEVWRPIAEFPDYQVSTHGRIIHVDRPNTPRSVNINHQGFPNLVLFKKEHPGSRYLRQVNKLVATAFLPPPTSRLNAVWHKDGDLLNCHVNNLMWDMRARVMEWNEMNRNGEPQFNTGRVMHNETGRVYDNAFELALHYGKTESEIVAHIERYPPQYADRARYRYV